ncbi:MAG: (deoxy)nucleoside triphosphate pyrophosphohydrolase [Deltaproteobacteria bacterium]|nr:(deoxy)nucleoside triphosphate pyrophosphohydrolase [Deltaproteobacteria bacterium]
MYGNDGSNGNDGSFESHSSHKSHDAPATRNSKPLLVVAAVLRREDGRILLARRYPKGPHGGLWEFPGGKVEPGETPGEALAREIREELGVEISVGRELTRVDHSYPHVRILLIALEAVLLRGELRALGCQDFRWIEPSAALGYPMPEADVPIARLACRPAVATPRSPEG